MTKAGYFDGGYAIHGEPAVPLLASHGCVRIPMGTSNIVAKLLLIGTRVYVRGWPEPPRPRRSSPRGHAPLARPGSCRICPDR